MRHLIIFSILISSLSLLTGCGGGNEGVGGDNALTGGAIGDLNTAQGINGLGMDETSAADITDTATSFMKTMPEDGGSGIFPPITTSDVPSPIMASAEDTPMLAQAIIPQSSSLSSQDRWTSAAIAAKEAGVNQPQGQADVIQSIYNRVGSPAYGCNGVADCVNKPGQYEPTFNNRSGWQNINSPESAARVTGLPINDITRVDQNINNPTLQQNAADHVGCFTDFQGMSQKPYKQAGDVDRGDGHNFFGNFYPSSGYQCK